MASPTNFITPPPSPTSRREPPKIKDDHNRYKRTNTCQKPGPKKRIEQRQLRLQANLNNAAAASSSPANVSAQTTSLTGRVQNLNLQ